MKHSFRSKPVGWRGESHRHYLASKGVKTKVDNEVKYFEPPRKRKFGIGFAETVLNRPLPTELPKFPHEVRLLKPEQKEQLKQDQLALAEHVDKAAELLDKDTNASYAEAESEIDLAEDIQKDMEMHKKGIDSRFFGGRPLTAKQDADEWLIRWRDRDAAWKERDKHITKRGLLGKDLD